MVRILILLRQFRLRIGISLKKCTIIKQVIFSLHRADDAVVVPQQAVELARDYLAPPVDSIGTAAERELLVREMRRDMVAAILRRVDASTKHTDGPTP